MVEGEGEASRQHQASNPCHKRGAERCVVPHLFAAEGGLTTAEWPRCLALASALTTGCWRVDMMCKWWWCDWKLR